LLVSRTHDLESRVNNSASSFLEKITPNATIQRTALEERPQILLRAEAMIILPLTVHDASGSSDLFLQSWRGSGLQLVAAPSVNAAFLVAAKSRRRRNQAVCQQVGN